MFYQFFFAQKVKPETNKIYQLKVEAYPQALGNMSVDLAINISSSQLSKIGFYFCVLGPGSGV